MMSGVHLMAVVLITLLHFQHSHSLLTRQQQLDALWTDYKIKFNKHYDQQQDQYRHAVWLENVNSIEMHNLQADLGQHTYTRAINQFTDWTLTEYRKTLLGFRRVKAPSTNSTWNKYDVTDLPNTVDWRTKGAVTPVKDQGQCGSCWSFSSTGSLEGQHFLKTGTMVSLSEQNLVDCTKSLGNEGCNGGWMNTSFVYIKQNNGIDTEDSYPYEAEDRPCRFKASTVGATCSGHVDVTPSGDESALMRAVAKVGPISVAIDAAHSSFQTYRSGVYNEPECTDVVDHAVLVVGYGTEAGHDYWLVKNSWAETWGDKGYIKMSRNNNNQCGIASYAIYPTVY